TLATSDSDTISVTPRIGLSSTVRAKISAQIRKVSANTQTTPAPFIRMISRSNARAALRDQVDRCCNTYIEPPWSSFAVRYGSEIAACPLTCRNRGSRNGRASGVRQPVPIPERRAPPFPHGVQIELQHRFRRI